LHTSLKVLTAGLLQSIKIGGMMYMERYQMLHTA